MTVQTPFSGIQALIIDDMAAQQSTLRGHLSLLGIAKADVATNPEDTSPAAHPTRIGTTMQTEARSANGQRRGTAFMTSMRRSGLVAGAGAERSAMCTACGTSSR